MKKTIYNYIFEDEAGEAFLEGTKISVAQIVRTLEFGHKATLSDLQNILALFPIGYLTLAKMYSAMVYYQDNKLKIESQLRSLIPEGFTKDKYGNYVMHIE